MSEHIAESSVNRHLACRLIRGRTAVDAHESRHEALEGKLVRVDGISQRTGNAVPRPPGVVVEDLNKLALDVRVAQVWRGEEDDNESEQVVERLRGQKVWVGPGQKVEEADSVLEQPFGEHVKGLDSGFGQRQLDRHAGMLALGVDLANEPCHEEVDVAGLPGDKVGVEQVSLESKELAFSGVLGLLHLFEL